MKMSYTLYNKAIFLKRENQVKPSRTRLQMANVVYTALKPLEIRQVFPAAFVLSKNRRLPI